MSIGMTYDQYWYGETGLVRYYYRADKLRQERLDSAAWLQGLYVRDAIEATLGNAIRQLAGSKEEPYEYPREPYSADKTVSDRTLSDEDAETSRALAWMIQFEQAGKNWGKKSDDE